METLNQKIKSILNILKSQSANDYKEIVDDIYYNICDILRTSNFDIIIFVYEEIDSLLRILIDKEVDVTKVKYMLERHNFLKEKHYKFSWATNPLDYTSSLNEFFGNTLNIYNINEREAFHKKYFHALTLVNSLPSNRLNNNEVFDEWIKLINSKISRDDQKFTYYVMAYQLQNDNGRSLNSDVFIEKLKTLISNWLSVYTDGIIYDLENLHRSGIVELKFPAHGNKAISQIDYLTFLYVFYKYCKKSFRQDDYKRFIYQVKELPRTGFTDGQIKILEKFISTYQHPIKKTRWDSYLSRSRAFETRTKKFEDKKKLKDKINKIKSIYQYLELDDKDFEEHISEIKSSEYFITE